MFGDTGDPTCFLCGRCRILDGSEKFLVYTFCLCGRCNILDTSEKVTVTLREVPRDTSSFLWQVPSLPPSSSAWPYGAIFFSMLPNIFCATWTQGSLVTPPPFCVAGATISMPLRCSTLTLYMLVGKGRKWLTVTLCGRRNSFNASEKYFVTQGLATLVTLLAFCVEGAEFSMAPRSSLCIRSACVAGANHWRQWWPYFLFVWQVQYFSMLPNIFCDSTSFLCGRCKSLATMMTLLSFCVAGAIFSMPRGSFSWPYFHFVWQVD